MFHCDILDCEVNKACELKSCQYNIRHSYSYNCLIHYNATHGSPTIAEVSHFYNQPLSELKKTYESAIDKVYKNFIVSQLEQQLKILYLKSKKICFYCESLVEDACKIGDDYVICKECNIFPEGLWEKSIQYGTTAEKLLKVIFTLFKNNILIDKFLDAKRGTAKALRSQYA